MATFNEDIAEVKILIDLVGKLKTDLKGMATESKKVGKSLKFDNLKEIEKVDDEIKKITAAEKELIKVKKDEARLNEKLTSLQKGQLDNKIKLQQQLQKETKARKDLLKANSSLTSQYQKESATLNNLRKRYKDMVLSSGGATNATRKLRKEITKLDTKLKKVDADVGQFQRSVGNYKSALTGSLGTVGQFATGAGAIAGGVMLAGKAIGSAIEIVREFDQSLKELGSITGLAGQPLEDLGNKAVEMSARFGTSSADILKGFMLVGSASPQLLENADALAEVTLQAEILSKAGGLELPEAAAALTKSMNQFGAGADEAAKFTDILATSQQKGTATIAQLSESMKNVGSVAKASGLDFEQTNAALQGLAKGGLVGAEAGSKLKTVLLKLAKTGRDDLNPATQDFGDILNVLKNEVTDVTSAQALFGEEAAGAALTLIDQKDTVIGLAGALNEQGNALVQAENNTDTLNGAMDKLNASWEALVLSMENGSGQLSQITKIVVDDLAVGLRVLGGDLDAAGDKFSYMSFLISSVKIQLTAVWNILKLSTIPFQVIGKLVARLAKRFGLVSENTDFFKEALLKVQKVFVRLPKIIEIVADGIINTFLGLADVAVNYGKVLLEVFNIKKLILEGKQGVVDAFANLGKSAVDAFKNGVGEIPEKIRDLFREERLAAAESEAEKAGEKLADSVKKGIKKGFKKFDLSDDNMDREKITLKIEVDPFEEDEMSKILSDAQTQINKFKEDQEAKEKKAREAARKERIKDAKMLADALIQIDKDRVNKKLEGIDREIAASKQREADLRAVLSKSAAKSNESLAFEQKKQAELEQEKEKIRKRQAAKEIATTAIKTYAAKVGNNDKNALGSTIADMTVLISAIKAISTAAGFIGGSDHVAKDMNKTFNTGQDDYLIKVDGSEKVFNPDHAKRIGYGMSNESVVGIVEKFKRGELSNGVDTQLMGIPYQSNEAVLNSIKESLDSLPSKMPTNRLEWEPIESMMKQTTASRNRVTRNHHKRGGIW
ncbi:MAG: phage tail tape measure protein [Colwellia sp.]|nr:phage tail tape measure protein [Colwellia sp.]